MTRSPAEFWGLIHTERTRVADLLAGLSAQQWHSESLCDDWTVEHVAAHLTAGANTGTWSWLRSIALAGFNADKHNARRLAEHLGNSTSETREKYREAVHLSIAPTRDYAAWLGEVVVHGQDIARPLGIRLTPDPTAVHAVAEFFAQKDFAVNSRSTVTGLALEATDSTFSAGTGPRIRGPLLSLVMAMAGRGDYTSELHGDGVTELSRRIARHRSSS